MTRESKGQEDASKSGVNDSQIRTTTVLSGLTYNLGVSPNPLLQINYLPAATTTMYGDHVMLR